MRKGDSLITLATAKSKATKRKAVSTMDDSDSLPLKRCSKCEQSKPATTEHFKRHSRYKDGLDYRCKECERKERQEKHPREVIPEGYKKCPDCKDIKPATTEHFYSHKKNKSGLTSWCIPCTKKRSRNRTARINPEITHKSCSKCSKEYPATTDHFHRNPHGVNGLTAKCKVCIKAEGVEYRSRKKETVYERTRQWRQANKERVRSYSQRYYAEHREHYRQHWKQYYNIHRERLTERHRTYNSIHRERHIEYLRQRRLQGYKPKRYASLEAYRKAEYQKYRGQYIAKAHRRRALLHQTPGKHTAQDIQQQFKRQKGKCYYCHAQLRKYHIDHVIPIARGGTNDMSNIVLACPGCNLHKSSRLPHEWPEGGKLL